MQAVILAGGEGTRLRPLTYTTPKPLLPICNIPFLEHQLALMQRHGITDAILLTGYLADQFQPFAARMKERGITLTISREDKPLGTCGAVASVRDRLDGTTIVFNGDVLTDLDLGALIASHREREAVLSLTLKPVDDAGPYGLVPLDDESRVQQFLEKPPPEIAREGGLINAGTYALEPSILDEVPNGVAWSFERQLFPSLVQHGARVYGFVSDAYWLDIGTPERYRRAHWDLIAGKSSFPRSDGSVLIGSGSSIDPGASVGPDACLGSNVVVEENASVSGSVLMDGVRVGSGASVKDCIIGPGVVVEAEKKIAGAILAAGDQASSS